MPSKTAVRKTKPQNNTEYDVLDYDSDLDSDLDEEENNQQSTFLRDLNIQIMAQEARLKRDTPYFISVVSVVCLIFFAIQYRSNINTFIKTNENTPIFRYLAYYLLLPIAIIVFVEFITLRFNFKIKPSTIIQTVGEWIGKQVRKLGVFVAYLSSFYAELKLELMAEAIQNLGWAIWPYFKWIYDFFAGYCETAFAYKYPILIALGSATIIGGIAYYSMFWY